MKSVTIVTAMHKEYQMPDDSMYLPLFVGATNVGSDDRKHIRYKTDDTGDNISELNASFCELTGLYWAWKNLDTDYIGLDHYRRHFGSRFHFGRGGFERVLSYEEIEPFLGEIKVFVPLKRRYYIETLYSHYAHTHYGEHLDTTRSIIREMFPEYIGNYDKVISRRSGYMFNMMIMQKEMLSQYCSWLFKILFELKDRIPLADMNSYQARCVGRIAEIIFNVWLDYQIEHGVLDRNQIKELPVIYIEKVDWLEKGTAFLKAKYKGARYEKSF